MYNTGYWRVQLSTARPIRTGALLLQTAAHIQSCLAHSHGAQLALAIELAPRGRAYGRFVGEGQQVLGPLLINDIVNDP